ncbi:MAG: hypothetical protein WDO18_16000 [Acidobacteriota bacterium]
MFPGAPERVRLQEVIRGLINIMSGGLIEGTIQAAQQVADFNAVRAQPQRVAQFLPEAARCSRELKQFLNHHVYQSAEVRQATEVSVSRMEALFDSLVRHPEYMSAGYREDAIEMPVHRQVCDYIAGMTDGFFLKTCAAIGV